MAMKTTSTTHNAGVPPAPPEAHQRAGEGCNQDAARLLNDDKAFGRAMGRLIAYVRRHAVPANDRRELAMGK